MSQSELKAILDYILNRATDEEMGVIVEAIKRRGSGMGNMSRKVASQIKGQLSMPVENIRDMVRNMAIQMIRQQVPDIPEEHLNILLKEWFPDAAAAKKRAPVTLPPDVLATMVKHFIKYSTGSMTATEQMKLKEAMPDWYDEYWERFPGEVRELITALLKEKMDMKTFWARFNHYLASL